MKEYVAETGGRYTYTDDLLNLQELALSFAAIFDGCSNFIISGCEVSENDISAGYVWLNGKIRKFDGADDAAFPYYIFERNEIETTTYANEFSKRGRIAYLCSGATTVPEITDAVTGNMPAFIEMKRDYSPRLIDKFFGKYAVLLESPFAKQTIKKELVLAGKLTGEKEIESKTALTVSNPQNGYTLKNIVKASGSGSVGVYLNGLLVNEIVIETDGSFSFVKNGKTVARIDERGMSYSQSTAATSQTGAVYLFDSHLVNTTDNTDAGSIDINYTGYNNGATRFRNFNVYGGKQETKPLFQVNGAENKVKINATLNVFASKDGVLITNPLYAKDEQAYCSPLKWLDKSGQTVAEIGHLSDKSFDFTITNAIGNICLQPVNGWVAVNGDLKINGVSIANIYVSQAVFNVEIAKKVDKITGKQLSTEDFSTAYRTKLDGINKGNLANNIDGYAAVSEVNAKLNTKLDISKNLSDVADRETARNNIDAEKKGTGDLKLAKTANLADLPNPTTARVNLSVYSKVEIINLLGNKLNVSERYSGVIFTTTLYNKLNEITTGAFYNVENGVTTYQKEGYVTTSSVVKELAKKANWLMTGYTASEKTTIADNLSVYPKTQSDTRYGKIANGLSDFLNHLCSTGYTLSNAKANLRNSIEAAGSNDLNAYISKTAKLTDLDLPNDAAKRTACQHIGAAFSADYQVKLRDTGWLQMSNYSGVTDTSKLFIRQIGNVVCIQGVVHTGKRSGNHQGGVVAYIPNTIDPPKYALRCGCMDYNDGVIWNRGASFRIYANSRYLQVWEDGFNKETEINFTYMT